MRAHQQKPTLVALAVLALTAGPGSAQASTPALLIAFAGLAPFDQLYIYPKDGASYSQQATDYYECDIWAVKQSGFDPTLENAEYHRTSRQPDRYSTCAPTPHASRPAAMQ